MLDQQLELFQELEAIPISIFDSFGNCEKLIPAIDSLTPLDFIQLQEWPPFKKYGTTTSCLMTRSLLLIGFIPDSIRHRTIILGPACTVPLHADSIQKITKSMEQLYPKELALAISGSLSRMKLIDLDRFQKMIRFLDQLINGCTHEIQIFQEFKNNQVQKNAIKKMTSALHTEVTFEEHDYRDIDLQDRILFYVSHGMVESLEKLSIPVFLMDMMKESDLRYGKNSLIVLNSLSQRAALSVGVPLRSTDSLGRAFQQQIESCQTLEALTLLSDRMFIPTAYARLVRDIKVPANTSRDIRTVIIYIQNHFREQISVKQLAQMVGLSEEHLSRKFKAESGMTLKDFIIEEKIQEAEALLRFTDLSLASISQILSFSSQSWFQTSFKKHTRQTPTAYRKANENSSLFTSQTTLH